MAIDTLKYAKRSIKEFDGWRIWTYRLYRWGVVVYARLLHHARFLGRENIPKDAHFIVASNHVSNLDPFLVGGAINRFNVCFLAKKELFERFGSRELMDTLGTICVNRQKLEIATIRSAKIALAHPKWCLGIFPEGTRVKEGDVGEAKKGVAFMARATQAPILPVAVLHSGPGKRFVTVKIGTLIPYEGQDVDTLTDILMKAIDKLKAEAEEIAPKLHGYKPTA